MEFDESKQKELTHSWALFKRRRISGALIVATMSMAIINFGPAVLSQRLEDLGTERTMLPLMFAIPLATPILASVIVYIMGKFFSYRTIILFSFPFVAASLVMIGPSEALFLPNELWLVVTGLAMLGFSAFMAIIPLFPEITEVIKETYQNMN